MPPLDLLPLSDSQQERLLKRTKDQHGEAATQSAGKPALVVLDRMGIRPLHDSKAQAAMQVRVEDMVWRQSCGMAFTPTAWAADRDQQWEMTRNFDRRGKPQVITPGLLPGIACCIPSGYGISVVYLEPERREGVRIEVEESEGQGKKEAKEGEEGEEEKSGSSSAQS
ncbi:hypothetical protein BDZ90DRAFT_111001 [Jaminaea rosea]|uniref:Uncharacterized protein n=1 Tax=Jaminaea rosea TaxID=1569628 RepID=A0A316UW07_9BASI|nr:hypothetical protein BDZ90DRAFT_111001 [Jaminaea rosea]PWN29480.1 hypothetical protein BDZ90DRAFT_111001 [Jaminaea rosea]